MGANKKRRYFDEDSAKRTSESQSQADEEFDTGDDAAQELPDDDPPAQSDDAPPEPPDEAPADMPDDAAQELISIICKLCQVIQRRQTAWEMTYCPTEPIEPDYYHLDLLVPGCKSLNIDLCVYDGRAVIRSEL